MNEADVTLNLTGKVTLPPCEDAEARAEAARAHERIDALPTAAPAAPYDDTALKAGVASLDTRVGALEGRPDDDADDTARASVAALASRVAALEARPAGTGTYVGQTRIDVQTLPGADVADKLRQFWANPPTSSVPLLVLRHGAVIDAKTQPIVVPAFSALFGADSVETEFGRSCGVQVRATGGTAVFKNAPRGSNESGTKGWSMQGLAFIGTGREDLFAPAPMDASGTIWAYNTLHNVNANQLRSVYQGPMMGTTISGTTYYNNMTSSALTPCGSDNKLFTDGLFMEMGGVATAAARAAIPAMIDAGTLSKSYVGPIYLTGSPGTPFRLRGGAGGVRTYGGEVEGRPNRQDGTLACYGALYRLDGGGMVIRDTWLGYAMYNPTASAQVDKGFVHVKGGDHLVDGCTYMPYTDRIAPVAYVESGHLQVKSILRGAGAPKPEVHVKNVAPATVTDPAEQLRISRDLLVDCDNSVTVKVVA